MTHNWRREQLQTCFNPLPLPKQGEIGCSF